MNDDWRADIEALAATVRRFALERIAPNAQAWDEAGEIPREVYREAGRLGLLGIGYPDEVGGMPTPFAVRNAVAVTLARLGGSGSALAALHAHDGALQPLLRHGSEALQQEVIPPVLRGEKIAALAVMEAEAGADVAELRTHARREAAAAGSAPILGAAGSGVATGSTAGSAARADDYVIDGEKTFVVGGMRADWFTVAVRTGEAGADGVSLLVVPGDAHGLTRTRLPTSGWLAGDLAHLRFEGVRVPARYLVGEPGEGAGILMASAHEERLALCALALGFAQACFDEALAWARERGSGGSRLDDQQVTRHGLVDMQMRIRSAEAWLNGVTGMADEGRGAGDAEFVAQVCMLKNHAMQAMQFCAEQAMHVLGGAGGLRGTKSERVYRDVKAMGIVGGAEEIMKDLAARQWGP